MLLDAAGDSAKPPAKGKGKLKGKGSKSKASGGKTTVGSRVGGKLDMSEIDAILADLETPGAAAAARPAETSYQKMMREAIHGKPGKDGKPPLTLKAQMNRDSLTKKLEKQLDEKSASRQPAAKEKDKGKGGGKGKGGSKTKSKGKGGK